MARPPDTPLPPPLAHGLARFAASEGRCLLARRTLPLSAALLAILGGAVAIDVAVETGTAGRFTLGAATWTLLAGACLWTAWPALRRPRALAVAHLLEARCHDLHGRLSSAVAFAQTGLEGWMVRRTIILAVRDLDALDPHQVVDGRRARRAMAGAAALLALGGSALVFPAVRQHLLRVLLPTAELVRPSRVELRVDPDRDVVLVRGQALTITVVAHPDPGSAAIEIEEDGRAGERLTLTGTAGTYRHTWAAVLRPLRLRAVAGDARSVWRQVAVVAPTEVTDLELVVAPPTSSRRAAWTTPLSDLVVPTGSTVTLRGKLTGPRLAQAVVAAEDGRAVDLDRAALSESRLHGTFTPDRTATYRLRLIDAQGRTIDGSRPWTITVKQDRPPSVGLEGPALENGLFAADEVVPLVLTARDDASLETVALTLELPDGRRERLPVPAQGLALETSWLLDLGHWALEPGDLVTLGLEATDGARQTAATALRRLTIGVPAAAGLARQLAELARIRREAEAIHGRLLQIQTAWSEIADRRRAGPDPGLQSEMDREHRRLVPLLRSAEGLATRVQDQTVLPLTTAAGMSALLRRMLIELYLVQAAAGEALAQDAPLRIEEPLTAALGFSARGLALAQVATLRTEAVVAELRALGAEAAATRLVPQLAATAAAAAAPPPAGAERERAVALIATHGVAEAQALATRLDALLAPLGRLFEPLAHHLVEAGAGTDPASSAALEACTKAEAETTSLRTALADLPAGGSTVLTRVATLTRRAAEVRRLLDAWLGRSAAAATALVDDDGHALPRLVAELRARLGQADQTKRWQDPAPEARAELMAQMLAGVRRLHDDLALTGREAGRRLAAPRSGALERIRAAHLLVRIARLNLVLAGQNRLELRGDPVAWRQAIDRSLVALEPVGAERRALHEATGQTLVRRAFLDLTRADGRFAAVKLIRRSAGEALRARQADTARSRSALADQVQRATAAAAALEPTLRQELHTTLECRPLAPELAQLAEADATVRPALTLALILELHRRALALEAQCRNAQAQAQRSLANALAGSEPPAQPQEAQRVVEATPERTVPDVTLMAIAATAAGGNRQAMEELLRRLAAMPDDPTVAVAHEPAIHAAVAALVAWEQAAAEVRGAATMLTEVVAALPADPGRAALTEAAAQLPPLPAGHEPARPDPTDAAALTLVRQVHALGQLAAAAGSQAGIQASARVAQRWGGPEPETTADPAAALAAQAERWLHAQRRGLRAILPGAFDKAQPEATWMPAARGLTRVGQALVVLDRRSGALRHRGRDLADRLLVAMEAPAPGLRPPAPSLRAALEPWGQAEQRLANSATPAGESGRAIETALTVTRQWRSRWEDALTAAVDADDIASLALCAVEAHQLADRVGTVVGGAVALGQRQPIAGQPIAGLGAAGLGAAEIGDQVQQEARALQQCGDRALAAIAAVAPIQLQQAETLRRARQAMAARTVDDETAAPVATPLPSPARFAASALLAIDQRETQIQGARVVQAALADQALATAAARLLRQAVLQEDETEVESAVAADAAAKEATAEAQTAKAAGTRPEEDEESRTGGGGGGETATGRHRERSMFVEGNRNGRDQADWARLRPRLEQAIRQAGERGYGEEDQVAIRAYFTRLNEGPP